MSRYAHAEIIAQHGVLRHAHVHYRTITRLSHNALSGEIERRERVDVDHTRHGVPPVQGALRTAHHLDA